jgi:lipopolysaccharide/colanic/teichoic acid biosynthesis glycosyltransferase
MSESSLREPPGQLAPDRRAGGRHRARRAADALAPLNTTSLYSKRAFDILIASVLLIIALPVFLVLAVVVRLTTPGPSLFRQTRVGRHGHPFTLLKFRTMYHGSGDAAHREYVRGLLTGDQPAPGGPQGLYKLEGDARITPAGHLLRRTSLDELPQLINVLRGEMSLVGPRPPLTWEAEMFDPVHRQRFLVAPGLTGLWQVSGRNRLTMRQGLDLDVEYVQRHSFWLDLRILARTVPAVLTQRGAR